MNSKSSNYFKENKINNLQVTLYQARS